MRHDFLVMIFLTATLVRGLALLPVTNYTRSLTCPLPLLSVICCCFQ